uniref:RRM domain-containing protein n=1 Tax=Timema tahoe TaxID=61484 RepID=A0A7R9ID51_9NEOP|nr:unnamed protein product [Timema tahoe]
MSVPYSVDVSWQLLRCPLETWYDGDHLGFLDFCGGGGVGLVVSMLPPDRPLWSVAQVIAVLITAPRLMIRLPLLKGHGNRVGADHTLTVLQDLIIEGDLTLVQGQSHSRSKKMSYRGRYRSRSRSRSPKRYRSRYSHSRSRSYSPRGKYYGYSDRRKEFYRSHSRSPMSSRRRHVGSRDNPQPSRCLGVFGLSIYTTEQQMHHIMSKYGPVERVQVVIDAKTGRSRGFSFVYFESSEDAKVAKEQCTGMEIDGRRIRVDFSITQRAHTPTPGIYMGKPTYCRKVYCIHACQKVVGAAVAGEGAEDSGDESKGTMTTMVAEVAIEVEEVAAIGGGHHLLITGADAMRDHAHARILLVGIKTAGTYLRGLIHGGDTFTLN